MSWSKMISKAVIVVSLMGVLVACGFSPVYRQDTSDAATAKPGIAAMLASIDIAPIKYRLGQLYASHLAHILNPDNSLPNQHDYELKATITFSESAFAIKRDLTVTRYTVTMTAAYTLTDKKTHKVIHKKTLWREGGYDSVDSDYATYVSKQETLDRLSKAIAGDTRFYLLTFLTNRSKEPLHENTTQDH